MGDIIQNNMLLLIPSWQKLLDYPTLGTYIDDSQVVSKILSDPVLFFGGLEATRKIGEQYLHFLFGVGYYYVKFELSEGNQYVLDNRLISGIVLSDFVYDRLVRAKSTAFQNIYDVVANDFVYKVPINLADKSATQRTFIDGTLMRQVFIPYKEIIMEFMTKIQSGENFFPVHSLLSATIFEFDKILLSVRLNPNIINEYMKPTPGINKIDYGAETLLHEVFNMDEIGMLGKLTQKLYKTYSTLAFNPIQLNTLLENASFALESNFPNPKKPPEKPSQRLKATILNTALENEKITPWPDEIPSFRRVSSHPAKSEIKGLSDKPYEGPEFKEVDVGEYQLGGTDMEQDQFELRQFAQKIVPDRPLPEIPVDDISKILDVIRKMVQEDYSILDIGKSIEVARDNIRKITLHTEFMFEMGKYANMYSKHKPKIGFNKKEKERFLEIVDNWVKTAKITNYPKIE